MNFHFEHIEYLLALVALPFLILLFIYVLRWKKSVITKIGNPKLVNQLIQNYSPFRFKIKFAIILLALVSIILAAANLQKPGQGENVSRNGVDIMRECISFRTFQSFEPVFYQRLCNFRM